VGRAGLGATSVLRHLTSTCMTIARAATALGGRRSVVRPERFASSRAYRRYECQSAGGTNAVHRDVVVHRDAEWNTSAASYGNWAKCWARFCGGFSRALERQRPLASPSSIQSCASVLFVTFLYPAKSLIRNGVVILDKPAERFLDAISLSVTCRIPQSRPCQRPVRSPPSFSSASFNST
jgi:hypothetical protein